jgi:beta-glucosidase
MSKSICHKHEDKWWIMNRFRVLTICGLIICLILSGCSQILNPTTDNDSFTFEESPDDIEDKVAYLLEEMTLDEKIGQMTQVEKDSLKEGDITRYFIGSVISGGGAGPTPNTVNAWVEMVSAYQEEALATRLGIPMIYGIDAIHGIGHVVDATIFPQPIGLGATHNPDLVRQVAEVTAAEMKALGLLWNFAPIVAVPQDIRWGRTYESYSEDTERVAQMGAAFVSGLQSIPDGLEPIDGQSLYVLATPKHFLGDGGTAFGTSTQNIIQPYLLDQGDMTYDEAAIRKLFLPTYQAAVESGAMSVMVSFSSWNGVKMHAQEYWITDVLKGELGFMGFVVSDWGGIDQVEPDYYSSVVSAINAGIDMNMVPYDYTRFITTMKRAVMKGDITLERINDAVGRILTVKFMLGMFAEPLPDAIDLEVIGSQEHRDLARQAVRESLVLLKNEKAALPISRDAKLIYVAGQGADDMGMQCGGWTTQWQGETGDIYPGTTLLDGIRKAVSAGTDVQYNQNGEFEGIADVGIVVVGEFPYAEGAGDRSELELSKTDLDTIALMREHSKKLVVVILSGRPLVITPYYQAADAWVAAWLPGTEGNGVADVLFGDYPFVGRLSYTWPRSSDQLPININNSTGLTGCETPLFPLGYGMGEAGSQPIEWLECP